MLNQMKQLYPEKQYAYYSGKAIYTNKMVDLLVNITSIPKDAEIDQWTQYFDTFIQNSASPKFAWKQIRDLCIANDVSTYAVAKLEDEYVRKMSKNPSLLAGIDLNEYNLKEELQTLIKSIIANLLASIILGA